MNHAHLILENAENIEPPKRLTIDFKIKEQSWIARVAAWKLQSEKVAIVMGRTIHLHNTGVHEFLQNRRWLLHELRHVQQFKQYGFLPFIMLYLWESILHGYTNNKYEIEAVMAETDEEFLKNLEGSLSRNETVSNSFNGDNLQ